jgi:hypothetical protein
MSPFLFVLLQPFFAGTGARACVANVRTIHRRNIITIFKIEREVILNLHIVVINPRLVLASTSQGYESLALEVG